MKNKTQNPNQVDKIEIPDDAYVYKYGMTIKEIREQIQYKIASINVNFSPVAAVAAAGGKDDDTEEDDEQIDTDAWDLYFPYRHFPSNSPKDSDESTDKDERSTEWDDEEINRPYRPSWAKEPPSLKCQHKVTRDVELIFTVATECVDCGERLK
jgi:hypothetical protein